MLRLSQEFKVSIMTMMYCKENKIGTTINLRIAEKNNVEGEHDKVIDEYQCHSKRDLVAYMANYAGGG